MSLKTKLENDLKKATEMGHSNFRIIKTIENNIIDDWTKKFDEYDKEESYNYDKTYLYYGIFELKDSLPPSNEKFIKYWNTCISYFENFIKYLINDIGDPISASRFSSYLTNLRLVLTKSNVTLTKSETEFKFYSNYFSYKWNNKNIVVLKKNVIRKREIDNIISDEILKKKINEKEYIPITNTKGHIMDLFSEQINIKKKEKLDMKHRMRMDQLATRLNAVTDLIDKIGDTFNMSLFKEFCVASKSLYDFVNLEYNKQVVLDKQDTIMKIIKDSAYIMAKHKDSNNKIMKEFTELCNRIFDAQEQKKKEKEQKEKEKEKKVKEQRAQMRLHRKNMSTDLNDIELNIKKIMNESQKQNYIIPEEDRKFLVEKLQKFHKFIGTINEKYNAIVSENNDYIYSVIKLIERIDQLYKHEEIVNICIKLSKFVKEPKQKNTNTQQKIKKKEPKMSLLEQDKEDLENVLRETQRQLQKDTEETEKIEKRQQKHREKAQKYCDDIKDIIDDLNNPQPKTPYNWNDVINQLDVILKNVKMFSSVDNSVIRSFKDEIHQSAQKLYKNKSIYVNNFGKNSQEKNEIDKKVNVILNVIKNVINTNEQSLSEINRKKNLK